MLPESQVFAVSLTNPEECDLECVGPIYTLSQDQQLLIFSIFDSTTRQPGIWCSNRMSGRHNFLGHGYAPAISPDGSTVVCLPTDLRHDALVLIDIASLSNRLIPVPFGPKTPPEFCLGGSGVIFRTLSSETGGKGGIYLLSLGSGSSERIIESD